MKIENQSTHGEPQQTFSLKNNTVLKAAERVVQAVTGVLLSITERASLSQCDCDE